MRRGGAECWGLRTGPEWPVSGGKLGPDFESASPPARKHLRLARLIQRGWGESPRPLPPAESPRLFPRPPDAEAEPSAEQRWGEDVDREREVRLPRARLGAAPPHQSQARGLRAAALHRAGLEPTEPGPS